MKKVALRYPMTALGATVAAIVVGTLLASVSAAVSAQSQGVSASGTSGAKITISLTDPTMALGTPDPTCEGFADGTVTGEFTVYSGATGNQGCTYVWGALTVTVKSNRPWSGTLAGADGTPTSGVTVANGSFRYDTSAPATSYSACSMDTALATTTASFEASGTQGATDYLFYHCVIVDWDDSYGTIDSNITYTVQH